MSDRSKDYVYRTTDRDVYGWVEVVRSALNDWAATDDPVALQDTNDALDYLLAEWREAERIHEMRRIEGKRILDERNAFREALIEIVNCEKGVTGHKNPYLVARRALAHEGEA